MLKQWPHKHLFEKKKYDTSKDVSNILTSISNFLAVDLSLPQQSVTTEYSHRIFMDSSGVRNVQVSCSGCTTC